MSIRETFSSKKSVPVTNEYDKVAVIHTSKVLGAFTILLLEASSEIGHFRHLSDYVFGVRNFENIKPMRVSFLLKIFKN